MASYLERRAAREKWALKLPPVKDVVVVPAQVVKDRARVDGFFGHFSSYVYVFGLIGALVCELVMFVDVSYFLFGMSLVWALVCFFFE